MNEADKRVTGVKNVKESKEKNGFEVGFYPDEL